MDPLSIAASAITVAALAASTCQAFAELRALCKTLPGRLHALSNEVTDFNVVLVHVATVFKERARSVDYQQQQTITHLLVRAEDKLDQLNRIVRTLITTCDRAKLAILQAHAWRKEQPKLRAIQEDIRTVKCSLNVTLGASNSRDMLHIKLELESLSTVLPQIGTQAAEGNQGLRDEVMDSLAQHHDGVRTSLQQVYSQVDQRIAKVEDIINKQGEQIHAEQLMQFGSVYGALPPNGRRRSSNSAPRLKALQPARSEGVRIRLNQYASSCHFDCRCTCHTSKKSTSPAIVDRVLGQLFVGYAGVPLLNDKCDASECEKSQIPYINLEYWFPLGFFWSQIVRLQVGYQSHLGPQISLSMLRRVPDSAQCVNFALTGNINGLKDLFKQGLASPRDVSSTRGYSVLRWALYGKQYQTCKFLVNAGADPDYRPISRYDNSPKNKAFDFILQGGLSSQVIELLSCLTEGSDFIEEQRYTPMHRIVLGLSLRSLEEELIHHPEQIDSRDAMGRTPLIWAAARGNDHNVALLLGAGADPNSMDIQFTTAVSYAAERDHTVCVRLLLEAGADPDPPLPSDIKVGSGLNCAARNASNPLLMKLLLDFGADVESSGVENITPLIHTARTDKASFAVLLLEYGADINATTTLGQTPLTTAITHNSHTVLQLLLDRWSEYSECPRLKGTHLLQIAALYADIQTIEILKSTNHLALSYDHSYAAADFATRLRERWDVSDELITAFDELLQIIDRNPGTRVGTPSLMESGLLPYTDFDSEKVTSDAYSDQDSSEQSFDEALEVL